jgi:hypothetical protein
VTLKEEVRDALAGIITDTGMGVAVVIDGTSGTGLRVDEMQGSEPTENGEMGVTRGTVRVSAAEFTKPERNATIRVDGAPCIVVDVAGSGALWVIQYRKARIVEGP